MQISPWPICGPNPGPLAETLRSPGVEVLTGHTVIEAKGRKQVAGRYSRRSATERQQRARIALEPRDRAQLRVRPGARLRRGDARQLAAACRPARRRATTRPAASSRSTACRPGSTPPARSWAPRAPSRSSIRERWPGCRRRTRWAWATRRSREREQQTRARVSRGRAAPAAVAVPEPVSGSRTRQVLRLPLRGRHEQGRRPQHRRGLRLDRAGQALHDGDDGSVPGAHVPGPVGPPDGSADGTEPGRRGHHDRPAALGIGADGRARRTTVRARQALIDPRPPP